MPFMDGYECCRRMKDMLEQHGIRDGSPEMPLIYAITGHVESEYLRRAFQSGMELVFSKPIKADTIGEVLLANRYRIRPT